MTPPQLGTSVGESCYQAQNVSQLPDTLISTTDYVLKRQTK